MGIRVPETLPVLIFDGNFSNTITMYEHEKHHDDAAVTVLRVASYQESFCLFMQDDTLW